MRAITRDDYRDRIIRVLRHMQDHLDEEMTPAELAKVASFSAYHFQRVFRSLTGESVMSHIRRLRLERAALALLSEKGDTEQGITGLAFDAGYRSHEAFTRAFSAHFGRSPREFRQHGRSVHLPTVPSGVHYGALEELKEWNFIETECISMEVEIKQVPGVKYAYLEHKGPYEGIGTCFEQLFGIAGKAGMLGPGMESFGLYYDDPDSTPAEKLRSRACLKVGENPQFDPSIGLKVDQRAGGQYAVVMYRGPYENLKQPYDFLYREWLPESGHEPADAPCFEIYINNPQEVKPEDLLTQICVPLAG
ncbi:MAG: AraC family transcriptional regulator [Planctomycetota bacterium]